MKTPEADIEKRIAWIDERCPLGIAKDYILFQFKDYASHASSQIEDLTKEVEKLRKFKKYVHDRLDKMGVPSDPEPANNVSHGCRIEGRLNFIKATTDDLLKRSFNREDNLKSENKKLTKEVERLKAELKHDQKYITVRPPEWHYWKSVAEILKGERDRYREALEEIKTKLDNHLPHSYSLLGEEIYKIIVSALHPLVKEGESK
jgi:hypothetical protein